MNTPDDLNALFSREPSGLDFPGPFQWHEVVVHGHMVPHLRASPIDGGVHLNLDGRYGLDLSSADAETVLPFIADCIAVAMGYTGHPKPECPEPTPRQPFPRMDRLAWMETDARTD
jgi:hypothetical protein